MFKYGDPGNHFYIVVQGKVNVRVPLPVQLEDDEATPISLLYFIIENYDDIYWKSIERKASIQEMIQQELRENSIRVDQKGRFDTDKAYKLF